MSLITDNAALESELRELRALAQENDARIEELQAKLKTELEATGALRIRVSAHEQTIGALRESLAAEQAGREADLQAHQAAEVVLEADLAKARKGLESSESQNKSVAAGVAIELLKVGHDPVAIETDEQQQGESWRDRYFSETDPKKRAQMWADHKDEIQSGK